MGRPNKPSGFSDKLIENYGSADYFIGFETDNDGNLNRKYPLEKVADYTLKHREMTIGNETKTVGGFITSANNRVKQTENTVSALSSSMSSQSTQIANLNSKVRNNEGNIGELQIDLANNVAALTQMNNKINAIESGPLVAETASQMTNTSKVYVYVGNEENYTNGDWYYYNGRLWVSGGAYNAQGLNLDTTLTVEGLAPDSKAAGDAISELDERKANIDGAYEQMTVGNAEQLVGSAFNVDSVPYNFRTAGGSTDIGDREFNTIVGATVGWNQIIRDPVSDDWGFETDVTGSKSGEVITISSQTVGNGAIMHPQVDIISNHVMFLSIDAKGTAGTRARLTAANISGCGVFASLTGDTWKTFTNISKIQTGRTTRFYVIGGDDVYTDMSFRRPQAIDLTTLFGQTIADYIYQLEQATAGAGVAFFKRLFPKDYYPYSEPTLMSAKPTSHDMVGFNTWDEEWEVGTINAQTGQNADGNNTIRTKNYIPIFSNTVYCMTMPFAYVYYYDAYKNFISYVGNGITDDGQVHTKTITTPSNAHYMRLRFTNDYGTTYNHDICINLSWSGYRNGEYEPYKKHSYSLGGEELRGILKLDSANNLYAYGDRYTADGVIERRFALVDLGTLNYSPNGAITDGNQFIAAISGKAPGDFNFICEKFIAASITGNPLWTAVGRQSSSSVAFNTPYSTAEEFKTAMSGVMLLYELAEPTTEESTPYAEVQIVDDFGTEEYVDTREIPIPVGHETKYPANLRDKLQHLPDLADSDGYYMIQQTSHDMSLIRFRIPQAPQEDGTYTLKATVSGGTPTYFWEEVTEE